jgi:hypothetical protein
VCAFTWHDKIDWNEMRKKCYVSEFEEAGEGVPEDGDDLGEM